MWLVPPFLKVGLVVVSSFTVRDPLEMCKWNLVRGQNVSVGSLNVLYVCSLLTVIKMATVRIFEVEITHIYGSRKRVIFIYISCRLCHID
jgi:hypothetical protein